MPRRNWFLKECYVYETGFICQRYVSEYVKQTTTYQENVVTLAANRN